MKKINWICLTLFTLVGSGVLGCSHFQPFNSSQAAGDPSKSPSLRYQVQTLPKAIAHILIIPNNEQYVIKPEMASGLKTIAEFAKLKPTASGGANAAIAALNAGFFDPTNQKSTSYIVIQEQLVADPKQNERLVQNPNLAPYLPKIFNRSEFRRYQCDQVIRYDITAHADPTPKRCQLVDAIGGGPRLLPTNNAVEEGFLAYQNAEVIRDPLGQDVPNARTAIGILPNGDLIWVMVAQTPGAKSPSGVTLKELRDLLIQQGATKALNLDGGSSSSLFYNGKAIYGKLGEGDERVQRPIKSALLLLKQPTSEQSQSSK